MPGIVENSVVRLIAYVATVPLGLISAIVTARWLGPSDKGVLATLTFMAVVVSQLGTLGLGEAAIVMVGQGKASVQRALSATVGGLALAAIVSILAFAATAALIFSSDLGDVWVPMLVTCAGLPVLAYLAVLTQIVNVHERFVATSVVLFGQAVVSAGVTVLLVIVWPLSVLGAIIGIVVGGLAGLVTIIWLLKQRQLSLRPSWDPGFLRRAVRYGVRVQLSGPPPLTDRLDLVLVYAIAGQAPAGHYSVALTLGTLVGTVPLALSHVSFPRLARLSREDALELTIRTCRYGVAASVVMATGFLAVVPIAIPLVFGDPYAPAVTPALALLVAYALSSAQWLLARAAAARGDAGVITRSYGANLCAMLVLDLALIPLFGISGAALAAIIGAAVGLAICLMPYARHGRRFLGLTVFLPTLADFRHLAGLPRRLLLRKGR
jgi:O-antigen/teichoic acid export membrane protein